MTQAEIPASAPARKCPFSGALEDFSLFSPEYIADPYPSLNYLREQHPVFYNKETDYWIVSRYEDVRRCLKAGDGLSVTNTMTPLKSPCPAAGGRLQEAGVVVSGNLINEDPPDHTIHRKSLQPQFSPLAFRSLEPFIRRKATDAIDLFVGRGHADLVQDFAFWIPAYVIFELMDIPIADAHLLKQLIAGEAKFIFGLPTDAEQTDLADKLGEFWKYGARLIATRRQALGTDLVSDLIRLNMSDPVTWSEDYITWMTISLIFAGHETTAGGMGNGFRLLLEDRQQWTALLADQTLIPNAVEEILRHSTPVLAWRRLTTRDIELSGVRIPAGSKLKIMFGAANRDGRVFTDPDKFDIRRSNASRHLTFGFGSHTCMGAPLARLEMKIVLEELMRRLPHIHLAPGQQFSYPFTTTHRGPDNVYVEWDPAQNPCPEDRG